MVLQEEVPLTLQLIGGDGRHSSHQAGSFIFIDVSNEMIDWEGGQDEGAGGAP